MLGWIQRRDICVVVPGQHVVQYLSDDVWLIEAERGQELPGVGMGCDRPPDRRERRIGGARQISGWPAARIERHHLRAIFKPDNRLRASWPGQIARMPWLLPQRRMLVEEPVEADDPLIRPGREKLGGEAGHDGFRRHLVQARFLAQVPPEDGCPDLARSNQKRRRPCLPQPHRSPSRSGVSNSRRPAPLASFSCRAER